MLEEESDGSDESWPKVQRASSGRSPRAPREILSVSSDSAPARHKSEVSPERETGAIMHRASSTSGDADVHARALEAERTKTKLLQVKVEAYEQRLRELEASIHHDYLFTTGRSYRHSPGAHARSSARSEEPVCT